MHYRCRVWNAGFALIFSDTAFAREQPQVSPLRGFAAPVGMTVFWAAEGVPDLVLTLSRMYMPQSVRSRLCRQLRQRRRSILGTMGVFCRYGPPVPQY